MVVGRGLAPAVMYWLKWYGKGLRRRNWLRTVGDAGPYNVFWGCGGVVIGAVDMETLAFSEIL